MDALKAEEPAIFALQNERKYVVPNSQVTSYEQRLGSELGISAEDVHSATSGTTTNQGDSKED